MHLNVSAEIKDFFQYIARFQPQECDMKTTLKCFIPELMPAIGDIDSFIKVPRPDGKPDEVGLKFLDEPGAEQSDPTVLELQLRAISKRVQSGEVLIRSLDDAASNPMAIDKWINSITELHSSKPAPQVIYRQVYPEIDSLLQEWPPSFQETLAGCTLPSPDLDISLSDYAKLLCSMLGIPTYDNPIESLHVMFTLYLTIKEMSECHNGEGYNTGLNSEGRRIYTDTGHADILDVEASNHLERK